MQSIVLIKVSTKRQPGSAQDILSQNASNTVSCIIYYLHYCFVRRDKPVVVGKLFVKAHINVLGVVVSLLYLSMIKTVACWLK